MEFQDRRDFIESRVDSAYTLAPLDARLLLEALRQIEAELIATKDLLFSRENQDPLFDVKLY